MGDQAHSEEDDDRDRHLADILLSPVREVFREAADRLTVGPEQRCPRHAPETAECDDEGRHVKYAMKTP